jgi:hypothetical protein
MKIHEIWDVIKNESPIIRSMVIESLKAQLNVRFQQIIDQEIYKLGIVHKEIPGEFISIMEVLLHEESWKELGCDKHLILPLYRELLFTVNELIVITDDGFGNIDDEIDIAASFQCNSSSQAAKNLLSIILDKVYHSEYIDISKTTLANLKRS